MRSDQDTAATPPVLLEMTGLHFTRRRRVILRDIDLQLSPGVTVLLGPNGAGKTTLLESLAFLRTSRMTSLRLEGSEVSRSTRRRAQRRIGFMPQSWAPLPGFSVRQTIQYALWLKGAPVKPAPIAHAVSRVDLDDLASARVSKLSGGQQRRVGLAEATAAKPLVLLLDEPTVGLDPLQRRNFREAVLAAGMDGSVLLSTHLAEDIDYLADRVLILADGSFVYDGSVDELVDIGFTEIGQGSRAAAIEAGYLKALE